MPLEGRVVINMPTDIHPHPETFSGLVTEKPKDWLNFLERYNKYKQMTDEMFVNSFSVYLKGHSLAWFDNLPETTKSSRCRLVEAFKERFFSIRHRKTSRQVRALSEAAKTA